MIQEQETELVYFSSLLPELHPVFFEELKGILNQHNIHFLLLHGTNDIWCKDYMPVQVTQDKFVQFIYDPSYLKPKKYKHLKTDTSQPVGQLPFKVVRSDIKLDGGNIIKGKSKALITDRVFKENDQVDENVILEKLKRILELDEIIVFPEQPFDYTGHADGLVRFINDGNVVVNSFSAYSGSYKNALQKVLRNNNLGYLEIPFVPSDRKNSNGDYTASGCYINYLQLKNLIVLPQFNLPEDRVAFSIFQSIFPDSKIELINCEEIADNGGVLNCISWNIKV